MGATGKGKVLVSVSIPESWERDILRRAAPLGLTRAAYLRLILRDWREKGMPPVSQPDRLMQLAKRARPNGG